MKRLFLIAASMAALAAALPPAGALARDHGRGSERHEDRGRGPPPRDDRAPPQRDARGPPPRSYERGPPPREDGRRDDHRDLREERGRYEDDGRWDDRRGSAPPPPIRLDPAPRRGGYLPRNFSGPIVDDYQRFRLRPPPRGYAWVRIGGGFALVSMADGQIFDVVQ